MASLTEWASVQDVADITGREVSAADRNLAASTIESVTGLIESVERVDITNRDRHWLKLATAYQAVFVAATPDYLERMQVSTLSQDGQSATGANPDWLLLSQLARKSIKRLSWRGPRGLNIGRQGHEYPFRPDVTSEAYDDSLPWRPM